MIYYVCKYTPIELFRGFGEECSVLEEMPENFEQSDQIAHANLCGFGKSVIQAVLEGKVEQLVLVNCCDSMRRVYDIVESTGKCKFLYMLDLPHDDNECEKVKFAGTIRRLKKAYEAYSGKVFDKRAFIKSFITPEMNTERTLVCWACGSAAFWRYDPGQYPDGCGKSDLYGWSETVGRTE